MRVYKYGAKDPLSDEVAGHLYVAWEYRRRLCEIERQHRDHLRAAILCDEGAACAMAELASQEQREPLDLDALRDAQEAFRAEVKRVAKTPRIHCGDTEGHAEQRSANKERRSRGDAPELPWCCVTARLEAIRLELSKDARPGANNQRIAVPVAPGTYQLVEQAHEQALKAWRPKGYAGKPFAMPLWDGSRPMDPRCPRWDGSGAIGVQIAGGLPVGQDSTHFRLVPLRDERVGRRSGRRHVAWLRLGTDGVREPIWARVPIELHRPLPSGCVIKRADLRATKRGPHLEWALLLTVDDAAAPREGHGRGVAGLDLGWRAVPGGVRVAVVADALGTRELVVPDEVLGRFDKVESLRSIRDRNLVAMRTELVALICGIAQPGWLTEACQGRAPKNPEHARVTIGQWASPARFGWLAQQWRDRRFGGDERAFELLEGWRKQDKHLWTWEVAQAGKALLHRRELYRVWSAQLARENEFLAIEDSMNLREYKEDSSPEQTAIRARLQHLAVGELRLALSNAFAARGGEVLKVERAGTTTQCSACGEHSGPDGASLRWTCRCGTEHDRDENAARNIRNRGSEQLRDRETMGTARNATKANKSAYVGRHQRAKEASKARRAA